MLLLYLSRSLAYEDNSRSRYRMTKTANIAILISFNEHLARMEREAVDHAAGTGYL